MVASIGTSSASFYTPPSQGVSHVNPVNKTAQNSYAQETQDSTSLGGSGYTFAPAANISALAPDTAGALISAQSADTGGTQKTDDATNPNPATQQNVTQELLQQATQSAASNQQQPQTGDAKPAYSEAGVNISV
jgi:hypothetical protein